MDISRHRLSSFPCLFLDAPASEFASYLAACLDLLRSAPRLIGLVERDLDEHGKCKKAVRLADARWRAGQRKALPMGENGLGSSVAQELSLEGGRPRTPAAVVRLLLLARGYLGGFKSSDADTFLAESMTLAVFLAH